jgi:hypothetical protein
VIDETEKGRREPVWAALSELWFGWRAIKLMSGLLGLPLEWKGAEGYAEV